MRKVVIYPGRFQPMLKHHVEVYNELQRKYPDADVYIGTSNKVDGDRSPFNFLEKQEIAGAHGIAPDKVIQVNNPYNKNDYAFNEQNTLLIFAVGEKDRSRLPVNNIDPATGMNIKKTDGEPSYLQDIELLNREGYNPEPMSLRGYVALAPNVESDGELSSASAFRNRFSSAHDVEHAKEIYKSQFGEYNETVFNLLYNKLVRNEMSEQIKNLRKLAGLNEAAPVVYTPDKDAYGFEEPEPGLNFQSDDFEPFDRKKSPAKQTRSYEPTSPKDAKASAERPKKAAGSDPVTAEFIPFSPDKFGKKHQKYSIVNRFGDKDYNEKQDRQDVFLKDLLQSPGNLLGEINSRLANDDNSLAVGDKLSSIINSMDGKGISGLNDEDRKFVIKLVANAVSNMDLAEPYVDPDEELEDSINFDDIREDYQVEKNIVKEAIYFIGARRSESGKGVLTLNSRKTGKDVIDLGNTAKEVATNLIKNGYNMDEDSIDYHASFKRAVGGNAFEYGFAPGEATKILDNAQNGLYYYASQSDQGELNFDRVGNESVNESIKEGGDCHYCKGDDPDCKHCDGDGYVKFDDDPNEPSQEEIDAYWNDIVKLSGVNEGREWNWEKGSYDEKAGYDANFTMWSQENKAEKDAHGEKPYSAEEMHKEFAEIMQIHGIDVMQQKRLSQKIKDDKHAAELARNRDMTQIREDGHLPEIPYEGEVDFMLDGDDGEPQDGSLTYTVIDVDHEAPGYGIKIDPKSLDWKATGPINPSARLEHGEGIEMIRDSDYLMKDAMEAALENEQGLMAEYWRSQADGMEPEPAQEGKSPHKKGESNMQSMFNELRINDNTHITDGGKELALDEVGPGFYLLGYDRDGSCFEMSKMSQEQAKDNITGHGEYKVADADITDFDGARYYWNENMADTGVLHIKKGVNEMAAMHAESLEQLKKLSGLI